MLAAGAVFLDRGGCCMRIELEETDSSRIGVSPEQIRSVLAAHVEFVRSRRRAHVPALTETEAAALGGARVLLSTFQRTDTEVGVVVALRNEGGPAFDSADVLASESVLAYGAQALSNVLMVRHLKRTALETVCTLVNAIDAKDNYTSDHSERVGGFARLTGEALGLPKSRLQSLEWGCAPARRGQDWHSRADIEQTRRPDAGRVRPDEAARAHRVRRITAGGPVRAGAGGGSVSSRASRRRGLPGRSARRADSAGCTDHSRRRHFRRSDDDAGPTGPATTSLRRSTSWRRELAARRIPRLRVSSSRRSTATGRMIRIITARGSDTCSM